jgi:hypothetical protein
MLQDVKGLAVRRRAGRAGARWAARGGAALTVRTRHSAPRAQRELRVPGASRLSYLVSRKAFSLCGVV